VIVLTSEQDVELSTHIGVDTVELEGRHFTPLVEANQAIKKSQPLIKADPTLKRIGFCGV